MIHAPEESAPTITAFGQSINQLIAQLGATEFVSDVVRETFEKFNLMYSTVYEIASCPNDWNGHSTKAYKTLEEVNRV